MQIEKKVRVISNGCSLNVCYTDRNEQRIDLFLGRCELSDIVEVALPTVTCFDFWIFFVKINNGKKGTSSWEGLNWVT